MATSSSAIEKEYDYHDNPTYRNFILCLKTPKTKKLYARFLDKYYLSRSENDSLTLYEIIKKIPEL